MRQVLSVVIKSQADTLVRLTGLCYRRGISIESLSYAKTTQTGEVKFRAVLACGKPAASQLHRQVAKLIGVIVTEVVPYNEGGM